jgi:hypothetical protein
MNPLQPVGIQASRAYLPRSYTVLADFDLQPLHPGRYTLEVATEEKLQEAAIP